MRLNKTIALSFALLPLLDIYGIGIPSLSIGKIILIVIFGYMCLINKFRIKLLYKRSYIIFMLFLMFISLVMNVTEPWFSYKGYLLKIATILGFFLSFGLLTKYLSWNYFIKYYKLILYICISFFLVQELLYFSVGYRLLGIIPGIPLVNMESSDTYILMQNSINRSCSFFFEPTYFVYYISVYFFYITFKYHNPFKQLEFLFLASILLLSRSGNGLMILSIATLISIIRFSLVTKKKVQNLLFLSLVLLILVLGINELNTIEVFNESFQRIEELSSEGDNLSSGFYRIYIGYYFINSFDLNNLLFGLAPGNVMSYYFSHALSEFNSLLPKTDISNIYLNGIQTIIAFGGIISLILYICFLIKLYINSTLFGKSLILLLFVSHFISSNFNSVFMLYILVISSILLKNDFNRCRLYK